MENNLLESASTIRQDADVLPAPLVSTNIPPVDNSRESEPYKAFLAQKDKPQRDIQGEYNAMRSLASDILLDTNVEARAIDWQAQQLKPYVDVEREEALKKQAIIDAQIKDKATLEENIQANFALNNTLGSWLTTAQIPIMPAQIGYDPLNDDIDKYWPIVDQLASSVHPAQTQMMKMNYDNELRHREILAKSSLPVDIIGGIASAFADPSNLLLFLGPPAAVARAGLAGKFAYGVGVTTTANAINEVLLHGMQTTRTFDESALNVLSGVLLDGAIGGTITARSAFKSADYQEASAAIKDYFSKGGVIDIEDNFDSVGAMRAHTPVEVVRFDKKKNPIRWALGETALLMSRAITPIGKGLTASDNKARTAVANLAETNIELTGVVGGIAAETLIKVDYRRASALKLDIFDIERKAQKEMGMSPEQFSNELDWAQRRGDTHENPLVQQAAQKLRTFTQDLWVKAAELRIPGTFKDVDGKAEPLEVSTAISYQTRVYDKAKVDADYKGFKDALKLGIEDARIRNNEKVNAEIDLALRQNLDGKRMDELNARLIDVYDEDALNDYAESFYQGVMNLKDGDIHFGAHSRPNILKSREPIADRFLEPFLEKNWSKRLDHHTKSLAPRVRLAEKFGDFEMNDTIKDIRQSYLSKIMIATEGGDTELAKKLGKEMDDQLKNLEYMRDSLLGRAIGDQPGSTMNSVGRSLLNFNATRMLNSMMLSSIPELAKIVAKYGMKNFNHATIKALKNWRINDLPKDEAMRIASSIYRAQGVRTAQMNDQYDLTPTTALEETTRKLAQMTNYWSGQQGFDSMFKSVIGALSQDSFVRMVRNADVEALNRLGFSNPQMMVIKREMPLHATNEGDLWTPNIDRWDLRLDDVEGYRPMELKDTFDAMIVKEADTIIVAPGVGDRPKFMSSMTGRILFQFKSFIVAATNRTLVPLTQGSNVNMFKNLAYMNAFSMASYVAYETGVGREVKWDDTELLVNEMLNRGGYTGYASEVAQIYRSLAGQQVASRYRNRDVGGFLGPSFGTATDMMRAASFQRDSETGELLTDTDARVHAFRKLLPFQNHFLIRQGLDRVEGEAAKVLGGEGRFANPK